MSLPKSLPNQEAVTIDLSALDALPDRKSGARRAEFTAEQDAALLKYWPIKRQDDVARVIGHAATVCRRRYEELTK